MSTVPKLVTQVTGACEYKEAESSPLTRPQRCVLSRANSKLQHVERYFSRFLLRLRMTQLKIIIEFFHFG